MPSLTILSTQLAAEPTAALRALICGAVGLAILLSRRRRLRGTTLVAAWWWAVASLALLTLTIPALAAAVDDPHSKTAQAIYFAAAMTTFCPLMALLGAKRPQHRAWQWVVLALWVILALPSGEWLLFHRGGGIHPARSWFLVVLILIGTLNYVATRFCLAALLYGVAEVALLARFLPGAAGVEPFAPHAALALFAAALAAAAWLSGRPARDEEPAMRLWRDFCNLFGAVWALRVAERLSGLAAQDRRPFRWAWAGILHVGPGDPDLLDENDRAWLAKTLRSLLLPFVSAEWIAQRLDQPAATRENPV